MCSQILGEQSIYYGYKENNEATGLGSGTTVPYRAGYNDQFIQ